MLGFKPAKIAAWTFQNVDGDVVTYLPHGGPELGEIYAGAWNDCALRAGRFDLVLVTAKYADGTVTLTAPPAFLDGEVTR